MHVETKTENDFLQPNSSQDSKDQYQQNLPATLIKAFPENYSMYKIFNRNTVKISCMKNIGSITFTRNLQSYEFNR